MSQPLSSPLLLENSNAASTLLDQAVDQPPTPKAPTSLPFRPGRSLITMDTPKGGTDLKRALNTIDIDHDINTRKSQHLIQKITKGFNNKDYTIASQSERIKALEARLEALQPKKRRKVMLSPNSKFADIKAIQRAQIEAGVIEASVTDEEDTSESDSEASTAEGDCIVVGAGIASSVRNGG